jgi:hypothetical protein
MYGCIKEMCIVANVALYFDLETEELYNGVVINRYERQYGQLRSKDPFLAAESVRSSSSEPSSSASGSVAW